MLESFKEANFRIAQRTLIQRANEIIADYERDGIQLTLRQLYYQFVARNLLPNTEKSYKNLGHTISEGRLAGLIDWSAIDDLGRVPSIPGFYSGKESFIDMLRLKAETGYVLDHWKDQEHYVELWVEKQALSSVLAPIAARFQVGFMMNKGYSSQTAMYDASKRFLDQTDKSCVLLYAGDHDPSGEDMVRDIQDRLNMFGAEVRVKKIALTIDQVRKFKCPPNPTKLTDSRATAYVEQFGNESWEVDALDPKEMRKIAEQAIKSLLHLPNYNAQIATEKAETAELTTALSALEIE